MNKISFCIKKKKSYYYYYYYYYHHWHYFPSIHHYVIEISGLESNANLKSMPMGKKSQVLT